MTYLVSRLAKEEVMSKKIYFLVDVQPTFMDLPLAQNNHKPGSLGVPMGPDQGREFFNIINKLLEKAKAEGALIIFSRDWHGAESVTFKANKAKHQKAVNDNPHLTNEEKKAVLAYIDQVSIWPAHGMQGTREACISTLLHGVKMREVKPGMFETDVSEIPNAMVISKGTDDNREAFSAFEGTTLAQAVADYIGDETAEGFIAGIAQNYCVRKTVLDACALEKKTGGKIFKKLTVYTNATPAVPDDLGPVSYAQAENDMKKAGAVLEKFHYVPSL